MANSSLLATLTSPLVLERTATLADSAWTAWSLRRKPKGSAAVLRRSLVSAALTQSAAIAGVTAGRQALAGEALREPLVGYRGPVGEVPVRVSATWQDLPTVTTVNDKLVMVVGTDFETLPEAEQEKQYRAALRSWFPPSTMLALGAGAALMRAALHRGIIGSRSSVSKRRSAGLALAMAGAELALHSVARQVTTRQRQARVARER